MIRRSPLSTPAVWPEWYLLCIIMSNSQPVWPGQHKPILQLQSSRELCSACAASPLKGSRCIYRVPCINKAPWSQHRHTLTPFAHTCTAGRAKLSPTAMGRASQRQDSGTTLQVFWEPQKLHKIIPGGYSQLQGWSQEAGAQHASSSYCVSTRMKESAWTC